MRLEWLKYTSSEVRLYRAEILTSKERALPQLVFGSQSLEEGSESLGVRPEERAG